MAAMLDGLGRLVARHARVAVLLWVLLTATGFLAATGAIGEGLFARLDSGAPTSPGEGQTAADTLAEARGVGPSVTLRLEGIDPASPALAAALADARTDIDTIDGVQQVVDPTGLPGGLQNPAAQTLVAIDGRGLLVTADLERGLSPAETDQAVAQVEERMLSLAAAVAQEAPGATGQVGGEPLIVDAVVEQMEADLVTGELIALPLSLAIMVIVFVGFLAAGLPIVGALASIGGALLALLGFSYALDLDSTVVNVVSVMGLGLSIDYGLLVVSRFREELRAGDAAYGAAGRDGVELAVGRTLATAGRTVLFSGLIVAISVGGLMIFPGQLMRALGAAGVSVVVVALLTAVTLVPALLALCGRRLLRPSALARVPVIGPLVRRLGDVPPDEGVFSRLARWVQRRPVAVMLAALGVLLLLGSPLLHASVRDDTANYIPRDSPQLEFLEALDERYPLAVDPPIMVVGQAGASELAELGRRIGDIAGVASVDPPLTYGDIGMLGVRLADDDHLGGAAQQVVREVSDIGTAYDSWVGGATALQLDFNDSLLAHAPAVIALVIVATFVLLFLMTGSLVVPLKALIVNTLSLAASLGVLVWGFQDGHLGGLLGFEATGGVESVILTLVVAFGFGLAMDYEVFLLARIKEHWDATHDNDESVVRGLQRSGRIITSAAITIIAVFGGFVAGELVMIKEIGTALAVAVFIDATLVRMLLVPATMTVLGAWNWWAPAPLRRLHERFGITEAPAAAPAPAGGRELSERQTG